MFLSSCVIMIFEHELIHLIRCFNDRSNMVNIQKIIVYACFFVYN